MLLGFQLFIRMKVVEKENFALVSLHYSDPVAAVDTKLTVTLNFKWPFGEPHYERTTPPERTFKPGPIDVR